MSIRRMGRSTANFNWQSTIEVVSGGSNAHPYDGHSGGGFSDNRHRRWHIVGELCRHVSIKDGHRSAAPPKGVIIRPQGGT